MSNCFVVEFQGRSAGLAVVEPRGVRFFAATQRAFAIDGAVFRSLAAVNAAVASLLASPSRRPAGPAAQSHAAA